MDILKKTEQFIEKENMISKGDGIVVAVSGGADSVALFLLLNELKEKYDLKLLVAHVNHMIRGEAADQDEKYVKDLAGKYGCPIEVLKKDVPSFAKANSMTEEEAGRYVRYDFFRKLKEKYAYDKIAVAHHMDDLAETVIFNMIRGSGIKGLIGISPVRDDIIRPLLCLDKDAIKAYLKEEGVLYCTDASNFITDYSRNRIRNVIIPELEKINARAVEHIGRISLSARELTDDFNKEADRLELSIQTNEIRIAAAEVEELSRNVRFEVYLRMMEKLVKKRKDISELHLMSIDRLVFSGDTGKSVDLPYNMKARLSYGDLIIKDMTEGEKDDKRVNDLKDHFKLEVIEADQKLINLAIEKKLPDEKYVKIVDFDKIKGEMLFRYPVDGDTMVIDSAGRKKKLSRIFIDSKIDREERDRIPLFFAGGKLVWAVGVRLSADSFINKDTKKILKISYMPDLIRKERKENDR